MATYAEIYNLYDSANILNRTTVAVLKIADYILTGEGAGVANHANRVIWATAAIQAPAVKARQLLWSVLSNTDVQNYGEAVADSTIQYIVEVKLDLFATGS